MYFGETVSIKWHCSEGCARIVTHSTNVCISKCQEAWKEQFNNCKAERFLGFLNRGIAA